MTDQAAAAAAAGPGPTPTLSATIARARSERWIERLFARDTSLWSSDPAGRATIAERREGPAVHHDIAVAVAAMPAFTLSATTRVLAAFPGARVIAFGHLGDGNLHFNVRPPVDVDAALWLEPRRAAITVLVHDLVAAAGGSISAEHGIGVLKRDDLVRLGNPAKLAAMRAIKAALDPLDIMNPGKLV